jgi:hypothetical protein
VLKTGGKEYAKMYLYFTITESFQCQHLRERVYEEEGYLFEFSSTFIYANHNLVLVFSINKAAKIVKPSAQSKTSPPLSVNIHRQALPAARRKERLRER